MSIVGRHRHRWTSWSDVVEVASGAWVERLQHRRCVVCNMREERQVRT